MATRRFKVSAGETEVDVIDEAGAAVNSDTFEFTVECASTAVNDNGTTRQVSKEETLDALEYIRNYIIKKNWPPV